MKNTKRLAFALLFVLAAGPALAQLSTTPLEGSSPNGNLPPPCAGTDLIPSQARVPCAAILLFSEGTTKEERVAHVANANALVRFNYHLVNSTAVLIPNADSISILANNPAVVRIIPDRPIRVSRRPGGGGGSSSQTVPAGVARIGAAPGNLSVNGTGVGVAIIDTGIDFGHADLSVSPDCFTAYASCQDDHGHGTHVAGIVAALNNSSNVVGVAPGAELYAVKVLDTTGSGSDSSVIAGLDWVGAHANTVAVPIRVVNMSLGRPGTLDDNPAMRESIRILKEGLGISVVVAAGNDSGSEVTENVPATYPEVFAVASTTARDGNNSCRSFSGIIAADTASYFSTDGAFDEVTNIGVTLSAPGATKEDISRGCRVSSSGILSLALGGGTTSMSGTSMASPHVAGVVALLIENAGGALAPELVRQTLRSTATLTGIAPLDSPTTGYTFDGEREGVLSACAALGVSCP